jgi:dienelactone hydrolase
MRVRRVIALLAVFLLAGCGARPVQVSVTPQTGQQDTPFTINAVGFKKGEAVTVTATGEFAGHGWRTMLPAHADAAGNVVLHDLYLLARLRPLTGVGPWPHMLTIRVRGADRQATATVQRLPLDLRSIKTINLRPAHVGFFGEYLQPLGALHRTAVVVFGGSDGDLPDYVRTIGSTLAGHGYPVLELAYFREPGLPQQLARIPLEYFRRPLQWIRSRPEIDANRIVSFGVSRGGELSLILASIYSNLVGAAVGYVPSAWVVPGYPDARQPAWTLAGKRYVGVPSTGSLSAIPVERIAGPVFVVGGGDDQLWPSASSVRTIVDRLHSHGRRDVTGLIYDGAGHLVGTAVPTQNTAPTSIPLGWGGSPQADEHGRERSWPKLLRFLASLPK